MRTAPVCTDRGQIVWLDFTPQAGHEQAGRRPALTVSSEDYNRLVGLALFLPITSQVKGYPFEVRIPDGLKVGGVVLSDQIKSFDWRSRNAEFCCKAPGALVEEALAKFQTLVRP